MAGLNPGPDILRLRQEPFDKLRSEMSAEQAVNLARLYFGLPLRGGTDWFRNAFGTTDPSFSLHENEREAAVLAGGLLSAGIDDGLAYCALVVLTTSAAGHRKATVLPYLVGEASRALTDKAIRARQRAASNPAQIRLPTKGKIASEAQALAQNGQWEDLVKKITEEAHEAVKNLANQAAGVTRPLAEDVADLKEEVEMLWWHIGGWSRILECPFSELDLPIAAVLAGIDLANLSRTSIGPAAAPAILQRTIAQGRKAKPSKVAVKDVVEGMPEKAFEGIANEQLPGKSDICPVLGAFASANAIGKGLAWQASYTKAAGFDPQLAMSPFDLALQAYRESQLLSAF
ncbi:hypothetical protein CO676_22800 [Sinorhizobium sp. BJ1]|nr:hypothetical protein CO676_22800 [Sinorhizobium sp. BJ1]